VFDYLVATRYQLLPAAGSSGQGGDASSSGAGSGGGGGEEGSASSSGRARVAVSQRVAAFLQPQDPLYFDVGSRAVAVYAYTYAFTRQAGAPDLN
jgi:hypothetical protein